MIKMEEDGNDDENVWNASAVILDIDSGVLNEIFFANIISNSHSQFLKLILICHVSGVCCVCCIRTSQAPLVT